MTRGKVDGYTLDVGPHWHRLTVEQREKICNGVGPASWCPEARRMLNKLPYLKPAADVHDVDFEVGGDRTAWKRANKRFRANAFRVAKAQIGYGWSALLNRRKREKWLAAIILIKAAYAALVIGSWQHWNAREV